MNELLAPIIRALPGSFVLRATFSDLPKNVRYGDALVISTETRPTPGTLALFDHGGRQYVGVVRSECAHYVGTVVALSRSIGGSTTVKSRPGGIRPQDSLLFAWNTCVSRETGNRTNA